MSSSQDPDRFREWHESHLKKIGLGKQYGTFVDELRAAYEAGLEEAAKMCKENPDCSPHYLATVIRGMK